MSGAPYYQQEDSVRNHFQVRLQNKRNTPAAFTVSVDAPVAVTVTPADQTIELAPLEEKLSPVFVAVSRETFVGKFPVTVTITRTDGNESISQTVTFLGPE